MSKIDKTKVSNNIIEPENNFIDNLFTYFQQELDAYYDLSKDTNLFNYNERAFLSLLTNGLIRNDYKSGSEFCFIPIQELIVNDNKNNHKSLGRLDLLICNSVNQYLIEAKRFYSGINGPIIKEWKDNETENYLRKVIEQAEVYYEAEIDYYEDKNTYLIGLAFEIVSFRNYDKYLEEIKNHESNIKQHFHYFFFGKDFYNNDQNLYSGLSVYGIVIHK